MRIAHFSPLPPERTGVARYARELSKALAPLVDLELFTANAAGAQLDGLPVHDLVSTPEAILDLSRFNACLYHLGNHPCHLEMYRAALAVPGVVVLHDSVLYFLMAAQGRGGLLKELCINHGTAGYTLFRRVLEESDNGDLLTFPHPARHPLLRRACEHATGLIVHSESAKRRLREAGFAGDVETISLIHYGVRGPQDPLRMRELRQRLGLREGQLAIGSFGFIGATKRLPAVFEALAALKDEIDFRLLIVGDWLHVVEDELSASGLGERVVTLGFVDDDEFDQYLSAVDVVVNLRYPSMGEGSATLVQAMSHGKACVVTDDAWFSELPNDTVWKIRSGPEEQADLRECLRVLARTTEVRGRLGTRAREFVERNCAPGVIARRYLDVIEHSVERSGEEQANTARSTESWAQDYIIHRTLAAYPTR